MTTVVLESSQAIDLWDLEFMFAVEDIDPRFGRVRIYYKSWSETEGKTETQMKMVPCNDPDYISNNPAFSAENLLKGRKDTSFLCPDRLESLELQGNFGAVDFKYVSIEVIGCDKNELKIPG